MIDADARAALRHRPHRVLDRVDGGLDAEVADRVTHHVAVRAPRDEEQRRELLARVEEEAAGPRRPVAQDAHRAAITTVHEDLEAAGGRVVGPLEPAARADHHLAHLDGQGAGRTRVGVAPRHRGRHRGVLDGRDAQRGVAPARRARDLREARLPRLARRRLGAAHRALEEQSRGLAGLVARDLATRRIRRRARDAGFRERARVADALVMREVHDQRGAVGHGGVEIAARRMPAEDVMVITDAAHPRTGGRLARGRRERPLDVGDGAGAPAVGPQRLEGADGEVIVRVDEAGDDGAPLEVDHLVVVLAQPQHFVGAADLHDASILHRQRLSHRQARVHREDSRVDEEVDHRRAARAARATRTLNARRRPKASPGRAPRRFAGAAFRISIRRC